MIPMRQLRFRGIIAGLLAIVALLFGIGAGHTVFADGSRQDMSQKTTATLCQASCPPIATVPRNQEFEEKNKDPEPQPAEPFYLTSIKASWIIVSLLSSSYLLKYLRRRPPDIFKLNVNYQF